MKEFIKDKKIYIIYAFITIFAFAFYLTHSHARWLNQDDLASLHVIAGKHSFAELLERNEQMGLQPPLAALIFNLWAQMTPATVDFIKGPSILAVTLSIYIVCCIGKRLKGDYVGAVAGILLAVSNYSFMESVFSIRTYGIFVLFSAVVFWYQLKITEEWENGKISIGTSIKYAVSITLLFYSHYFGVILAFALGVAELVKIAVKWKQKPTAKNMMLLLAPYFAALLCLMPYALGTMLREYASIGVTNLTWTTVPKITDIPVMVYYFFSNVFTFAVFAVLILILAIYLFREKVQELWAKQTYVYVWVTAFYILFAFVYSAYLAADGSFWVRRYFCCLMPPIYLLCAIALDYVRTTYLKGNIKYLAEVFLAVVIVVNWYDIPFNTTENVKDEYKPVIEYLNEKQVDAKEDAVIYSSWWGDAFNYFYTDNFRNEKKPAVLQMSGEDVSDEINTIYVLTAHINDWDNRVTDPDFVIEELEEELPLVKYVRK